MHRFAYKFSKFHHWTIAEPFAEGATPSRIPTRLLAVYGAEAPAS